MKVIKSLENRGNLLRGTTKKYISREERFLNFLRPLLTAGLRLLKSVLTLLAKNVLLTLGLTAAESATVQQFEKEFRDQELQH